MALERCPVLVRALSSSQAGVPDSSQDGPALTQDGRAMDLDGGRPLFFSHDRELASGYAAKCAAKRAFREIQVARLAHAAREAEARLAAAGACALGPDGV